MTCGIYQICNTATKYRYVGLSRRVEERWGEHWKQLNRGCHPHPELQRAWTSNGANFFECHILEELSIFTGRLPFAAESARPRTRRDEPHSDAAPGSHHRSPIGADKPNIESLDDHFITNELNTDYDGGVVI